MQNDKLASIHAASAAVIVRDLSMLAARLARQLKIAAPEHELPAKATAYLQKHDLIGSPLRADDGIAEALATAERMLDERNQERTTVFPERTVVMEFTHQHIGDRRFAPEIVEAMRQLIAQEQFRTTGTMHEFTATNSVMVKITSLDMADPPKDAPRPQQVTIVERMGNNPVSGEAIVQRQNHAEPMEGINIDAAHRESE